MKRFQFLFLFLFAGFQLIAQSKVGTIDVDFILSRMPELVAVNDSLKSYSAELDNQIQVKVTKYQSLVNVYKENEKTYNETDKKGKQDEIIAMENEIQQFRKNSNSLIQIKQNNLLNPLYKKIGEAMNTVVAEDKYTQVFTIDNSLVYLDPAYDITIKVMEIMGIPFEPEKEENKN